MSVSHTPGPWSAKPHADGWHITAHTPVKTGGAMFTRVATAHGMGGADAKLIAAAPELLARCKEALAAWEGSGPSIALDDLRAVIARAEGQS